MNQTELLKKFTNHLRTEEKSRATIEKYTHDVRVFLQFCEEKSITKELVLQYKEWLLKRYAPSSVNSMLVALNCYFVFIGKSHCRVKQVKIQRQIFARQEKDLTRVEYQKLLYVAGNSRIALIMQTICGTGIRISELSAITVEAVYSGKTIIHCKSKLRVVFIPLHIQLLLKHYIRKQNIKKGPVFITRTGKPINRSNIWKAMKALGKKAGIAEEKIFPHNLRHLFAKTFYSVEKDIVQLADLLGHSSINTTRIYTMDNGQQHLRSLEKVSQLLTT